MGRLEYRDGDARETFAGIGYLHNTDNAVAIGGDEPSRPRALFEHPRVFAGELPNRFGIRAALLPHRQQGQPPFEQELRFARLVRASPDRQVTQPGEVVGVYRLVGASAADDARAAVLCATFDSTHQLRAGPESVGDQQVEPADAFIVAKTDRPRELISRLGHQERMSGLRHSFELPGYGRCTREAGTRVERG